MTGLECGHRFCVQCWGEYLTTKIMEEGVGQTIACAAHGCDILVDDATVMRLVRDSKVRLKYQHLITNSFVEVKKALSGPKWLFNNNFFLFSATVFWDGVLLQTATMLSKSCMLNAGRWRASATTLFASLAVKTGMIQSSAASSEGGSRSVMMIQKLQTGSQPTPRWAIQDTVIFHTKKLSMINWSFISDDL